MTVLSFRFLRKSAAVPPQLQRVTAWLVLALMVCFSLGEGVHALSAGHLSGAAGGSSEHGSHHCHLRHFGGGLCRFHLRSVAQATSRADSSQSDSDGALRAQATGSRTPQWNSGTLAESIADECPFCQSLANWVLLLATSNRGTSQPFLFLSPATVSRSLFPAEPDAAHLTRGPPTA